MSAVPQTDKAISICHVLASRLAKGGLEKNVVELAGQQAAMGHAVSVVSDETLREFFSPAVNFHSHSMRGARLDPLNLLRLRNSINAIGADVVHAHANKAGLMVRLIGPFLGNSKRVATVQNIKSSAAPFKGYDAVITASAQVRESLRGIPATVIWNSIEPPASALREQALMTNPPYLDDGQPVFSTVGRLVPAKGMDLLLQAVARVPGFKLWLIGDGEQRPELEALLDQYELRERVWMAGHRDDAVGLMACSDLFVVASRNEGGPYTLVEALHMRVPCISTRVGFAPEFLDAALLMQTHNVDELERGLRTALADMRKTRALAEAAFDLAATQATLQAMTNKVLAVYDGLLRR